MRYLLATTTIILLATVSGRAQEHKESVPRQMAHKWERGVVDLFTGVVEVPMQTVKGYRKGEPHIDNTVGSKSAGTALGFLRGVGFGVSRTVGGLFDMVTFWTNDHPANVGVGWKYDVEYAWEWERTEVRSRNDPPSFWAPVENKLVRSVKDVAFGVTEVPYEVRYQQTQRDGSTSAGVGIGLWRFVSRELNGVYDLVTFLLPNHEADLGPPYRIEDPWNHLKAPPEEQSIDDMLGI